MVGPLALGIFARPRCTRDLRILVCQPPSLGWRGDIRALGYSEEQVEPQSKRARYAKGSIYLTLVYASWLGEQAAIANSQIHTIFGVPLRFAEPNYLLWSYLVQGDQAALAEAIELINHGDIDRHKLASELKKKEPLLMPVFFEWLLLAAKNKASTYSDSVECRLRRLSGKDGIERVLNASAEQS